MAVSKWERKALIPFGAAAETAREVGCSRAYVSLVIATGGGATDTARAVRAKLAKKAGVRERILFPAQQISKQTRRRSAETPVAKDAEKVAA